MTLEESIRRRRSLYPKQMSGEKVPIEVLEKMLEMANWAPTHLNTEPWRFKVFAEEDKDRLLDHCKNSYVVQTPAALFNHTKIEKLEERKKQVSHIIVICMQRNNLIPEFEEIAATAMAVQNMWLYLTKTLKYGGYWSTPAYALDSDFAAFLHLSESERCLGLFYVGTRSLESIESKGQRGEWAKKVSFYPNKQSKN